jgi:hypothetical protein
VAGFGITLLTFEVLLLACFGSQHKKLLGTSRFVSYRCNLHDVQM